MPQPMVRCRHQEQARKPTHRAAGGRVLPSISAAVPSIATDDAGDEPGGEPVARQQHGEQRDEDRLQPEDQPGPACWNGLHAVGGEDLVAEVSGKGGDGDAAPVAQRNAALPR